MVFFYFLQPDEIENNIGKYFSSRLHELVMFNDDGEEVGSAALTIDKYKGKPVFYMNRFDINEAFRDNKFGSKLLEMIQGIIEVKEGIGLLIDRISVKEAVGMYQKRGWEEIDKNYLGYNLPDEFTNEDLDYLFELVKHKPN